MTEEKSQLELSPRKKRLFRLVFILTLILPFVLLELFVRVTRAPVDLMVLTGRKAGENVIMLRTAQIDAFSAYKGRPGQYGETRSINEFGFIATPELAVDKPPDTIRIVFLGGSSTAGIGSGFGDEETWPWQTVELLRERFPTQKFELINGSMGGFTSFESYGRLWSRIRFFSPDIIVVYHGWNEMYYMDNVDEIVDWRTLSDGDWTFDRTDKPIVVYEPLAIDYLIWPSQTLSQLRLSLSEQVGGFGEIGEARPLRNSYDTRGLEIWRTNLQLFEEAADIMEAELFVAKQATLIVPGLPEVDRANIGYQLHGFDHDTHVDMYQEIYQVIEEELSSDHIIDVTSLSGQTALFHDHVHPTPGGAEAIAEIMAESLTSYLEIVVENP
jgi:lysophospholipase L1-like esterase